MPKFWLIFILKNRPITIVLGLHHFQEDGINDTKTVIENFDYHSIEICNLLVFLCVNIEKGKGKRGCNEIRRKKERERNLVA